MGKGCFGPKLYKKNIILSQATCPIAPGQASRVYIEEGVASMAFLGFGYKLYIYDRQKTGTNVTRLSTIVKILKF